MLFLGTPHPKKKHYCASIGPSFCHSLLNQVRNTLSIPDPILWMRKLRLKEIKQLAQCQTGVKPRPGLEPRSGQSYIPCPSFAYCTIRSHVQFWSLKNMAPYPMKQPPTFEWTRCNRQNYPGFFWFLHAGLYILISTPAVPLKPWEYTKILVIVLLDPWNKAGGNPKAIPMPLKCDCAALAPAGGLGRVRSWDHFHHGRHTSD